MSNHDKYCRECLEKNQHSLISWWIMGAYAYDRLDNPIISDQLFDEICISIQKNWDKLEHRHKYLLDITLIKSSIAIKEYPTIAQSAATRLTKYETEDLSGTKVGMEKFFDD